MDRKDKILKMYYEKKHKMIDIANRYKISKQYVSKIIKQNSKYEEEKENRKKQTRLRKEAYRNKKMKEYREEKLQENARLKQEHKQATSELSGGRTIISNRAFRKWNASAYKYNKSKNCYEFDRKLTRTYSTPRYIK